jgi:DNA-binding CsgD family transcriptional regulator
MSIKAVQRSQFLGSEFVAGIARDRVLGPTSTDWPQLFQGMGNLLHGIRRALDSDVVFLAGYDVASFASTIYQSDNVAEDFLRSYSLRPSFGDTWSKTISDSIVPGKVWTAEDVFVNAGDDTNTFYRSWLLPQGAAHVMGCMIGSRSTQTYFVVVGRRQEAGPFDSDEMLLLSELLSPIHHLPERQNLIGQLRNISKTNLEVLDLLPVGIIVFNGHDRPIMANRYALDIMNKSGMLSGSTALPKYLEIGFRRRRPAFAPPRRNGASSDADSKIQAVLLERPHGEGPLSGVLYHLDGDDDEATDKDNPAAVMFVSDPGNAVKIDRARLQCFYGLTPAEARIAALLAEGAHLEDVSDTLGISLYTARTHLKRIFSKVGTQTQADLVRLVLDLSVRVGC